MSFPQPGLTRSERRARAKRQIKFRVRRKGRIYEGTILLPVGMMYRRKGKRVYQMPKAEIEAKAKGDTKEGALATAAGIADQIASNPIVAAALPPGTSQALKALRLVSKNAPIGKLDDALKKLTGAGAKRIASALKFW